MNAMGGVTTDHAHLNIAIGQGAMCGSASTEAQENIAIGRNAMDAITTGCMNVAIGCNAFGAGTTGCKNISIGGAHNGSVVTGSNNIAIGPNAGYGVTSASNTVMIGLDAGYNGELNLNDSGQSNKLALGNPNFTHYYAHGSFSDPSDCRDKSDVKNLDLGLGFIKALRPVYFKWDRRAWYEPYNIWSEEEHRDSFMSYKTDGSKKQDQWEVGLLAQEVLEAEKEYTEVRQTEASEDDGIFCKGTDRGTYKLTHAYLIMPLIKAVQELSAKVEKLEKA